MRNGEDVLVPSVISAHWTFAVTVDAPFSVNVQLFVFSPALEQAPDQIASRPLDTVKVIALPMVNEAEPLVPVAALIPAGLDVISSPLRPVAFTVSVAV